MTVKLVSTGDTFTTFYQFYGNAVSYGLGKIKFRDGTIWDRTAIAANAWIRGTSGNDSMSLPVTGIAAAGGAGDDGVSVSGTGADTIIFAHGDGHDTLNNPGGGYVRSDVLYLVDSLSTDVQLSRAGDAMTATLVSTGDTFTTFYQI